MSDKTKKDPKWPQSEKKPGEPTHTATLPLNGEKCGVTKGLDNRTTIMAPPDPKVVEAAQAFADACDKCDKAKDFANEKGQVLLDLFLKSKKARKVKVVTEARTYYFSTASLTKLVTEKKQSVN